MVQCSGSFPLSLPCSPFLLCSLSLPRLAEEDVHSTIAKQALPGFLQQLRTLSKWKERPRDLPPTLWNRVASLAASLHCTTWGALFRSSSLLQGLQACKLAQCSGCMQLLTRICHSCKSYQKRPVQDLLPVAGPASMLQPVRASGCGQRDSPAPQISSPATLGPCSPGCSCLLDGQSREHCASWVQGDCLI